MDELRLRKSFARPTDNITLISLDVHLYKKILLDLDLRKHIIEAFYDDTAELVRLLLSLVKATAFDLTEAADVYRVYARHFWINARGEQTEGHPEFGKVPGPRRNK